ncbi:uncharacterized protein LOC132723031 [Ruditapes philippinarum]|uniref:uncharacterized protein LOC132723031 n=1 Tax=Ruditapes philippinarum TaxID=129788 RepID=UPI00295B341F|nr:uncharacterized protein LOC132723031 [Ruditapes philippinarum]
METKILLLCLHWCFIELVMARLDLDLNSQTCGNSYNLEDVGEVHVTYNAELIDQFECSVKLINWASFTKQTCVKPLNFKLNCNTIVEYRRHLLSKYLTPEKRYTCHNASVEEWCGPKRTAYFFLLFKRQSWVESTKQSIVIKVYLRDFPGEGTNRVINSSSSGTTVAVAMSVSVVFIVIILIITCGIIRRRRMENSFPRSPYMYQTGSSQIVQGNAAAGQHLSSYHPQQQPVGYQGPPQAGYQPPQQAPFQPGLPGNYQIHDMQSAYPGASRTASVSGPGYQPVPQTETHHVNPVLTDGRFPAPSAPTSSSEDQPPSYDSVVK